MGVRYQLRAPRPARGHRDRRGSRRDLGTDRELGPVGLAPTGSDPSRPTIRRGPARACRRPGLGSFRERRVDGRARRRVARARPGDQEGTHAWAPGPPAAGPTRGDALPTMPERAHLRHGRADRGRLPRSRDAGARCEAMPARPVRLRKASLSRPRDGHPDGAPDRRALQPSRPSRAVIAMAPSAATATREKVTTQGAQLGSAIGSRRERSGSTKPSHSSTTRRSR
jgi:hypothetical protein